MMIFGPILAAIAIARCHASGELPDRICTPGAVETVDLRVICGTPTRGRRNVSDAVRRERFASYGIAWADRGRCALDHLVPLELGGSNEPLNLWPEPRVDADRKDQAENALHHAVCLGRMPVVIAQRIFETDWTQGSAVHLATLKASRCLSSLSLRGYKERVRVVAMSKASRCLSLLDLQVVLALADQSRR